jgi:hypothetical protein
LRIADRIVWMFLVTVAATALCSAVLAQPSAVVY